MKNNYHPTIIGIDPGKAGGIAILHESGAYEAHPMPDTPFDVWDLFTDSYGVSVRAYLELVHAMPGQGVTSMFTFGKGVGHLEMALTGCAIPYETVHPRTWMKALGIRTRKKTESKTDWKKFLRGKAQQLFPRTKVTLNTADALLIAEYGLRQFQRKGKA